MERPIDRAVTNPGITPTNALENLASGQMGIRPLDFLEDFRSLRCVPESLARHYTTHAEDENESH
jgi:hypothetical protein